MQIVEAKSVKSRVRKVRSLIESAGNRIFAISFVKRSDGSKRKMVCRRQVMKTQYAGTSKGKGLYDPRKYNLLPVFDVNTLKYNHKNRLNGRGGWKSVPLDSITRIKTGGEIYKITS